MQNQLLNHRFRACADTATTYKCPKRQMTLQAGEHYCTNIMF